MSNKTCRICQNSKSLIDFPSRKSSPDGRRSECKTCYKVIREPYLREYLQTKKSKAYFANYRLANFERMAEYQKEYLAKDENRKRKREWYRKYENNRRKNPIYRLRANLSRRIRKSLKANKNGHSWEKLVGYSLSDLKNHLQALFQTGMSWDNYGQWHIDHIRPIDSFNITSVECDDFLQCWSLQNLQPLWRLDNLRKKNKWSI